MIESGWLKNPACGSSMSVLTKPTMKIEQQPGHQQFQDHNVLDVKINNRNSVQFNKKEYC